MTKDQKRKDVVELELALVHRQVVARLLNMTLEAHVGANRSLTVKISRSLRLVELNQELEGLNDTTLKGVVARNALAIEGACKEFFDEGKRATLVEVIEAMLQVRAGWIEMALASDKPVTYRMDWAAAKVLLGWLVAREHWAWEDERREKPVPLHFAQIEAIWYLEEQ